MLAKDDDARVLWFFHQAHGTGLSYTVVTVTAPCLLEDDSEPQFELVSSAPGFIHVSDAYRKENKANGYAEGIGVLYVTPQLGDAGKYVVSLQVKACSGKVERVITFKLHVKQARQD